MTSVRLAKKVVPTLLSCYGRGGGGGLSVALAAGGASIASAPTVQPGIQ